MDPVLTALAFHRVTQTDWFSSSGPDGFISCDFFTSTVQGYPAERAPPVKRQKVDDGPVMPVMAPAIHVNWISGVARKTISKSSGITGDTVVYLMMLQASLLMALRLCSMSLMFFSRRRRIGREMVGHPLKLRNVQLLPQLWHGFQRKVQLRAPISSNF